MNFENLHTLKPMVDHLTRKGYANIIVLDNRSTYPPLLEYYATCPCTVVRLARNYGTRASAILEGARTTGDLGRHFGADLYEREVAYLMDQEWARSAEDVLWRRSKLGLHLSQNQADALGQWMRDRYSETTSSRDTRRARAA